MKVSDVVTISDSLPPLEEYMKMRKSFGWANGNIDNTRLSLENSLFRVCLEINGKFIGFGRIVGDGILNFYIQDIMIKAEFRGRGYARIIMEKIMAYIEKNAAKGSFVGLFSVSGLESLYSKYGFLARPVGRFGAGMFQMIVD